MQALSPFFIYLFMHYSTCSCGIQYYRGMQYLRFVCFYKKHIGFCNESPLEEDMEGRTLMSLSELRTKDVVNVCNGKRMGKVMDIEFNVETGHIEAIVIPGEFDLLAMVKGEKRGVIIPWNQICCFGNDIILVQVNEEMLA